MKCSFAREIATHWRRLSPRNDLRLPSTTAESTTASNSWPWAESIDREDVDAEGLVLQGVVDELELLLVKGENRHVPVRLLAREPKRSCDCSIHFLLVEEALALTRTSSRAPQASRPRGSPADRDRLHADARSAGDRAFRAEMRVFLAGLSGWSP